MSFIWICYCLCTGQGHGAVVTTNIRASSLAECPKSFPASSGSFSNCVISGVSGRVFSSSGILTLQSCTFTSCSSSGYGGCVYSRSAMYVYSCSFRSCWTYSSGYACGGAICAYSGSLTTGDSYFDSCSASWCGGAIDFDNSGGTNIATDCVFTNCKADVAAGGIYVWLSYSQVDLMNCSFLSCLSVRAGGGCRADLRSGLNVSYCLFDSCVSKGEDGGAMSVDPKELVSYWVTKSEIRNCVAAFKGGALIFYRNGQMMVSELTIANCSASDSSSGQAIHIVDADIFQWYRLCITGMEPRVVSQVSYIAIPTSEELSEGCIPAVVTAEFTKRPTPSWIFRAGSFLVIHSSISF